MGAFLKSDPVKDIVDFFRMQSNMSDGGEAAKQGFPIFARFLRGPLGRFPLLGGESDLCLVRRNDQDIPTVLHNDFC